MRKIVVAAALVPALLLGTRAINRSSAAAPVRVSASSLSAKPVRKPGPVPLVRQAFRNNCETAALSMILASVGKRVDQEMLQRQLRRSGPLDPIVGPDGIWTWGAPGEGFVGRVQGGGTAGGFGVYQGPIRRLAATYGVDLDDLSRKNVDMIISRLREHRPVLAWIGLSDGPYRRWRTPSGRTISVNLGEHAVVLVGLRGSIVLVNDPLTGGRVEWTIDEFATKWRLLGQRALGV